MLWLLLLVVMGLSLLPLDDDRMGGYGGCHPLETM